MCSCLQTVERERSAMMKWITIIPCFVILVIADDVSANQCNLYNFGMQGGFGCAMQWFQQEDLGQTIPVTYKISDMVQSVLTRFNISSEVMLSAIPPPFQTGSPDPMAKIIESMATLEPFLAFLVADVIEAVDFTSDQLQQLGIPGELSTRANRVTMIREYFDFSCSDKGMKSLVSCLRNWISGNCQGQADNQVTNAWLDRLQNAYCDGTIANPQVISELLGKLGTIKEALQFFGLKKDPSSPYGMKILPDAPIIMSNLTSRPTDSLTKTCPYVTPLKVEEIFSVYNPNSTLGAGTALKAIMRFTEVIGKCVLEALKNTFPQYQEVLEKLIDAGTFITTKRDGLNFDKKEANVDGERSSTVAYGDPHVVLFDKMEHETCAAKGWQIYLANKFFAVQGFSATVANGADGTFINLIQIDFRDRKGGMLARYFAELNETLRFSYEDPSANESITIESDGDMDKIIDHNSKAVFLINKYRFTSGELYKLFAGEDDYYKQRRLMLAKTDILVIDEISMVSSHTLHQVNRILQYCKGTEMVMGGVQRIFCGDFLQLPPIGNELSGDIGEPAILNDRFELYVPHKVELIQVQRTSDAILSRVIQEVSKGNVGPESMRFLESKSEQPCKTEGEKLVLYGTRDNVTMHNAEALQRHPGLSHTFIATDFGDAAKGRSVVVEKKLRLKVGAPVMLIKNISDKLVNGLRGRVADLKQASVVVHFPSLNITYTFKAVDFTRVSNNIVVRMADSLYDQSFGLLVTGCLSPLPPFTERASDECQQVCNAVPDEYQRTCLFDCQTTGDLGVGAISTLTENLKEAAEKFDEMVKEKSDKSPESSSPGSFAAFVTMEMSLIATTLILSVIY